MKNMSTTDGIGIELTVLGWSHDPPFKPQRGLMLIPIYSSPMFKATQKLQTTSTESKDIKILFPSKHYSFC